MKYLSFDIGNYRAIEKHITIDFRDKKLIPLVGINECGKTTILQAIYSFDFINDSEYEGKHISNCKNLYKTSDEYAPGITATIEADYDKLAEIYSEVVETFNSELKTKSEEEADEAKKSTILKGNISKELPFKKSDFNKPVRITRNLNSKAYYFPNDSIQGLIPSGIQKNFVKEIVRKLPFILYNDDFNDRPENILEIPKKRPAKLTGWLAIYERLFKATDQSYSLFKLAEEKDSNRRDSILADVEHKLNETLTKDWKKFSVTKKEIIRIKLKFIADETKSEDKPHRLNIQVVEEINGKARYFDVKDRSKGFLWFFNFVMKLEFNPKVVADSTQTIYLLDEPGSYLHLEAQRELCKKLVSISEKHGVVVYCTHSHKLLNPEIIPLNSVYIVEKNNKKNITATPLPLVKTKIENNNAFQPIIEATQTPAYEVSIESERILVVEGIYDKYAIASMLDLEEDVLILAGTGAASIGKNIQYLNAYKKTYAAIWDNDPEGVKEYNNARKFFGEVEAQKFDLLPQGTRSKRRMEEMFASGDIQKLLKRLSLPTGSSYESVISGFQFSTKGEKIRLRNSLSDETKENFRILGEIIKKRFQLASAIVILPDA